MGREYVCTNLSTQSSQRTCTQYKLPMWAGQAQHQKWMICKLLNSSKLNTMPSTITLYIKSTSQKWIIQLSTAFKMWIGTRSCDGPGMGHTMCDGPGMGHTMCDGPGMGHTMCGGPGMGHTMCDGPGMGHLMCDGPGMGHTMCDGPGMGHM